MINVVSSAKRFGRQALLAGVLISSTQQTFAWSDHASLLWPLLRTQPELLETRLTTETLDAFILAEADGLTAALRAIDVASQATFASYPALPEALVFRPNIDRNLTQQFLGAIRVNPTLPYSLYQQVMPEDARPIDPTTAVDFNRLSFLKASLSQDGISYRKLAVGELVSPAVVLASGNDEPDFGIDVGLFADNNTEFGLRYGFGKQPFGNAHLDYGTQAPFHMGFYHLDWLTKKAQPGLLQTYPEWRIFLFSQLAEYAFNTGHDYWGWRFMGWALHYIGDLTQPYHTVPLPGVSTPEALWLVVQGKTNEAIQLVSNRHGVLESYQLQRMRQDMTAGQWHSPLLAAAADSVPVPKFDANTVRQALTYESAEASTQLDATLEMFMPWLLISDPGFEWTGSSEEPKLLALIIEEKGASAIAQLDGEVASHLHRFARYAQMWVNQALTMEQRD